MMDSFFFDAALAGLGVSLAAAPLGCFIVWNRMAYFSDATSHAAILGIAISLALQINPLWGIFTIALVIAIGVSEWSGHQQSANTILGVFSYSTLAAGLVAVNFLPSFQQVDLMGYLFGDILLINSHDVIVIWGGAIAILALLYWRWSSFLITLINPDLALSEGINPHRERRILMIAFAAVIVISIKVVGALLIGAMLIIPAAAARPMARTPHAMAITAGCIAAVSSLGGIEISILFDAPTGPVIVCAMAFIFLLTHIYALIWRA